MALREDLKERFKYEVDRSSPANKLRGLMSWSRDIITDIHYMRGVFKHPFLMFLATYWLAALSVHYILSISLYYKITGGISIWA